MPCPPSAAHRFLLECVSSHLQVGRGQGSVDFGGNCFPIPGMAALRLVGMVSWLQATAGHLTTLTRSHPERCVSWAIRGPSCRKKSKNWHLLTGHLLGVFLVRCWPWESLFVEGVVDDWGSLCLLTIPASNSCSPISVFWKLLTLSPPVFPTT